MDQFMEQALEEARLALDRGEVPVGCVFVYKGSVIARGSNYVNATKNATRHAEFVCIDGVLEYCKEKGLDHRIVFPEVSVIVSVEPCIMCAAALHNLKVKEILFGCINDRFGGFTVLDVSKVLGTNVKTTGGCEKDLAMGLLKDFYKGENPSAPVPKLKRKSN